MSNRWNNKVWDKLSKEDLMSLVNDLWLLSEKYEEQIHKAIEYIERNCLEFNKKYACQGMNNDMVDELLDILKGSDSNE